MYDKRDGLFVSHLILSSGPNGPSPSLHTDGPGISNRSPTGGVSDGLGGWTHKEGRDLRSPAGLLALT